MALLLSVKFINYLPENHKELNNQHSISGNWQWRRLPAKVKTMLQQTTCSNKLFLSETEAAKNSEAFKTAKDFPAIYQNALAMIYPQHFLKVWHSGFRSHCKWFTHLSPVTSVACPKQVAMQPWRVNPASVEEMKHAMQEIISNALLRNITD